MAMRYGASILPVVTPVVLRLMDASTTLSTVGQAMLTISFMVGGSWRTVSHNFQVVNKTVFGPVVVGSDFASQYCQGMRWGPDGGVTIAGAAEVSKADDDADGVVTYKLDNILGVEVTEKSDGSVIINSSDFILTKGPSEDHFTCKWIWLNDVPPPPIRSANQGDYAPRLTEEEEASLREEAKKLVDNHWIRKYDEQIDGEVHNILRWVLVPQPHKSTALRMCLDFRGLNKLIRNDVTRELINASDTLHRWRSVRKGYTLDVTKCYYCIRMDPSLFKYLAIFVNGELHCMLVLPFGLGPAPKIATAAITWLLRRVPYPVSAYLDDIVVEETDETATVQLDDKGQLLEDPPAVVAVRQALLKGDMRCKPTHVIGYGENRVLGLDLVEKDGCVEWRRRKDQEISLEYDYDDDELPTRRELAGWCGRLTGFVPIASWLRPHIGMLLRAMSDLEWDREVDLCTMELAWYIDEKLRQEGDPAMGKWYCPKPGDAVCWHLHSDASGVAMGATLSYEDSQGNVIQVRDACWLLSRREMLRHININELCAAAKALIWAAPYVCGTIRLYVDNECVRNWISKFLGGASVKRGGLSATVVGRRLQAIFDTAETFDSLQVHRVETTKNPSDILSRVEEKFLSLYEALGRNADDDLDIEGQLGGEVDTAKVAGGVSEQPIVDDDLVLNTALVIEAQYDDEELYIVRRSIKQDRLLPEKVSLDLQQVRPQLEIDDYDMIVRTYVPPYVGKEVTVPVIPDALKHEFVHSIHGILCHAGQRRTLELVSSRGWFPRMLDEASAIMQGCDICSRRTRPLIIKHDIGLFSPSLLKEASPFSVVCADVVYLPEPYLSQQCYVTKFACLLRLDGEDASSLQSAFEATWKTLGKKPSYLLTDNGAAFLKCDLTGVVRLYTAPRSSQSNGQIESLHRTVRMWMRSAMADDESLTVEQAIAKVMKAYNRSVHFSTGRIPADMLKLDTSSVEWQRLVDTAVLDAEKKIDSCTRHELYPGAVVRVRAVNKFDKVVTKTSETPFSERRWRVVGFLGASGLVTRSADYGVYRKVKIVSDSETRILHVTRLVLCAPTEIDVLDLRRAMRRIAREESK